MEGCPRDGGSRLIRLRVVGSSEDHSELILSNKPRGKRGSHKVVIDKKLLDVLQEAVYGRRELEREAVRAQRALEPRAEPKIPPREIQRQLRAGASPAEVARAAGVDEAYVDQFYPPIVYERVGVIQDAHELHQEKPRLGPSKLPLGDAVEVNLAARRVNMSEEALTNAWSATRKDGQPWTILFTFPFRGRSRTARWRYDPRVRELTPQNKIAIDVGWVSPSARVTPAQRANAASARASSSRQPTASRKPAGKTRAGTKKKPKKRAARKRTPPKRTAKKRAAPKRTAKKRAAPKRKAAAKKRAAPKRTAKKTASRRKPATRRKAATRTPSRRRSAAKKPARRPTATRRRTSRRR